MQATSSPGSSLTGALTRLGERAVRLNWPYPPGWLDAAWAISFVLGLIAIIVFPDWETIPLHLIWISATLLYGFRTWPTRPTLFVLGVVLACTGTVMGLDVVRDREPLAELTEVPMMAAMFGAMVWHARRKLDAEREARLVGEENARLLATQRRFLQDASHELKTPITIALGHSELLARHLADNQDKRDINVVVGELTRLRTLSQRLLLIAASASPDFLRLDPVELDHFLADVLLRWRPTADRCWQLGELDPVTALVDAERLGLAIDALLENAVQHTRPDDLIRLSLLAPDGGAGLLRVILQDTGTGISADELAHIFDRFATGPQPVVGRRGTGLGLSLVRAVAEGHGGEVRATSVPGLGSKFELVLPAGPVQLPTLVAGALSVPVTPPAPAAAPPSSTVVTAVGTKHEYPSAR